MAREARRKEFLRTAVRYNNFIIPKEFTLFFLSTQDYFNPYKSFCTLKALRGLYLRRFPLRRAQWSRPTVVSAPSDYRLNCNGCDSCCRLRAGTPSVTCGDSSKNSKNSLKKPKVSSPSGREPLVSANFGHRIVGRDDSARRGRKHHECNFHKYIEGAQQQF